MKVNFLKLTAILLIFAGSFSSCKENDDLCTFTTSNLCTDDVCIKYLEVWKDLFVKKNKLTECYLYRHIELDKSSVGDWIEGTSITICYSVKVDWAVAYNCDQFIIKIKEGNTLFPALNVPRGDYLTKGDIEKIIDFEAFASEIIKLSPSEKLKFKTMDDAIDFAIRKANVNTLDLTRIFIDKATGHISLEAVESHYEINKCIFVTLDLINGKTNVVESVCLLL